MVHTNTLGENHLTAQIRATAVIENEFRGPTILTGGLEEAAELSA